MADHRNDLRDAPYSAPELTHERLAPTLIRYQEAGTLYYQPWNQDSAAITNRSPLGSVTANSVTTAYTTYSCGEILSRQQMSYDAIRESYADKLRAELAMARLGKRAVDDTIEVALATSFLGSPKDLTGSTNIPGDVEAESWLLRDKTEGRVALTVSNKLFTALKSNSQVADRMKNIGITPGNDYDIRNVAAWIMAQIMGVDEVIVAPDRCWSATIGGDKIGVLSVLPDGTLQPNEQPQVARVIAYQFGETDSFPFECTSWEYDAILGSVVDTKTKAQFKVLNSNLKQAIRFFEADASSSDSASASA